MIELLLKAGADANTALPEGETALMTAARTGKVDAMQGAAGARRQRQRQGALEAADGADVGGARRQRRRRSSCCSRRAPTINDRSIFGWTPLLFAARQGQIDTIKALVAAGANVNDTLPDGTSALVTAVQGLNYEAADVAAASTASIPTPPDRAGPRCTRSCGRGGRSAVRTIPGQKPQGNLSSLDLARKLVEHGADVNARQTKEPQLGHGRPQQPEPLRRHAVLPGRQVVRRADDARCCSALGADPFLGNVDGDTPLMVAAGVGVYSQGESPGEPEESAEAVKMLLDLGAPVNDVDKNGETALHGPAWRGSNEAVMLLVNAGAKLDVRNNRGWLPLTIADGVYYNARVMMNLHTAKLLRELMVARGLDASDEGTSRGGALRDNLNVEDELDAQNPSEVQRKLIEQQQKRNEALKKLQDRDEVGVRQLPQACRGTFRMEARVDSE